MTTRERGECLKEGRKTNETRNIFQTAPKSLWPATRGLLVRGDGVPSKKEKGKGRLKKKPGPGRRKEAQAESEQSRKEEKTREQGESDKPAITTSNERRGEWGNTETHQTSQGQNDEPLLGSIGKEGKGRGGGDGV